MKTIFFYTIAICTSIFNLPYKFSCSAFKPSLPYASLLWLKQPELNSTGFFRGIFHFEKIVSKIIVSRLNRGMHTSQRCPHYCEVLRFFSLNILVMSKR